MNWILEKFGKNGFWIVLEIMEHCFDNRNCLMRTRLDALFELFGKELCAYEVFGLRK